MKIPSKAGRYYWLVVICLALYPFIPVQSQVKTGIPPFNILLTNNKYLKAADLTKNMPLMLVYFDPDCDHCKEFTGSFISHINDLKQTQIVMISFTPVAAIKKFETEFKLGQYANIKLGTEGLTFVVQRYYNIQKFPFIAIFNKKGVVISTYYKVPAIDELITKLNMP